MSTIRRTGTRWRPVYELTGWYALAYYVIGWGLFLYCIWKSI